MNNATIKASRNGWYQVSGNFTLLDSAGKPYTTTGDIYLCRCGQSKNKPFCDSSHKAAGFESTVQAPPPPATP